MTTMKQRERNFKTIATVQNQTHDKNQLLAPSFHGSQNYYNNNAKISIYIVITKRTSTKHVLTKRTMPKENHAETGQQISQTEFWRSQQDYTNNRLKTFLHDIKHLSQENVIPVTTSVRYTTRQRLTKRRSRGPIKLDKTINYATAKV
jgi:hypothetical protein